MAEVGLYSSFALSTMSTQIISWSLQYFSDFQLWLVEGASEYGITRI